MFSSISSGWRILLSIAVMCMSVTIQAESNLPTATSNVTYGNSGNGSVLVLGCVTNNPKYNYGRMKAISDYMLDRVGDLGIDAVEVFVVDSHDKMISLLRSGRVDWVSATPYSALIYESEANSQIIATKKIRGNAEYESVFFARSDSGINSIGDLVDKVIAFEKPGSTSAYFLPSVELLEAGFQMVELRSPMDKPPAGTIGYVFSGDEANSSIWVHKRFVSAAAFSSEDWDSDFNMPSAFREDMKIFHRTSAVPRSVEVVRSGLNDNVKTRIKQVLFAANNDPDAADALDGYYHASDFADLSAKQSFAMDKIRNMMDSFQKTMTR